GWVADDDFKVRFATRRNPDASIDLLQPAKPPSKEKWTVFQHVELDDAMTVRTIDFDKTGNSVYLRDSRNRDTGAVVTIDTRTGASTVLAEDPRADVSEVLVHPTSKVVEAVLVDYDKPTWKVVDASVEADFFYLQQFGD